MRSLSHDLEMVFPNAIQMNRGKLGLSEIVERALKMGVDRIIILERWKGGPGRIRFCQLASGEVASVHPILILGGVKTQIDFGHRKNLSNNLALTIHEKSSKEIVDLALYLSNFLGIPSFEEGRLGERFKAAIHLGPTPTQEVKIWFTSPPMVEEVGPRLVIRKIVWGGDEVNTGLEGA